MYIVMYIMCICFILFVALLRVVDFVNKEKLEIFFKLVLDSLLHRKLIRVTTLRHVSRHLPAKQTLSG